MDAYTAYKLELVTVVIIPYLTDKNKSTAQTKEMAEPQSSANPKTYVFSLLQTTAAVCAQECFIRCSREQPCLDARQVSIAPNRMHQTG